METWKKQLQKQSIGIIITKSETMNGSPKTADTDPDKGGISMAQVTKSTMIGELLQIDANIAPVLLNIGMHCLGCPFSQRETIEKAAMVHGIEPDALVEEINTFLAKDLAE